MAVGREQSSRLNIAVSSGAGTGNITPIWAIARWVRVIPVNETDTYTLQIKDADGQIMVKRSSITGTYSEKLEMSCAIMATINITAASVDGTYTTKFDMQ